MWSWVSAPTGEPRSERHEDGHLPARHRGQGYRLEEGQ